MGFEAGRLECKMSLPGVRSNCHMHRTLKMQDRKMKSYHAAVKLRMLVSHSHANMFSSVNIDDDCVVYVM